MSEILSALEYLHENNIAHNDIKPENIVIFDNDIPTLIDFEHASRINIKTSH